MSRIIFDNGGGATLQTTNYQHSYDDMDQLSSDVTAYLKDQATSDWEGNEIDEYVIDPTNEEIRNGGYRIVELSDLDTEVDEMLESSWFNQADFARSMRERTGI